MAKRMGCYTHDYLESIFLAVSLPFQMLALKELAVVKEMTMLEKLTWQATVSSLKGLKVDSARNGKARRK
jgi:hypothetical protein